MLPENYRDARVCIIGLGYVGLTLAVAMAESGFHVIGVERDRRTVRQVSQGKAHFAEKGLDARLAAQVRSGHLVASVEWPAAGEATVYIITVGTPLAAGKTTNLDSIREVARSVAAILRPCDLVVLRSTVRLGVSRQMVKPVLDEAGVPFDLAFCPERTLEGRALEELRTLPQIVGGVNQESAVRAAQMFAFVTPTAIRVSSLEAAEMIKLVNNTQRDLMFAFSNEIAGICDRMSVSATEVIRAGNMGYPRASMPMPGPVGGPCLEKDAYILAEAVLAKGGEARLTLMGRAVNEDLTNVAAEQIGELLADRAPKRVAIFGLAFKGRPETSDLRGTLAIKLIADVRARFPGVEVVGYDPAVPLRHVADLGITPASSVEHAATDADCILFQNNNPTFEMLDLNAISRMMAKGAIIYDLWSQFDITTLRLANHVRYAAYGSLCFATEGWPEQRSARGKVDGDVPRYRRGRVPGLLHRAAAG